jgi:hypothetical protein
VAGDRGDEELGRRGDRVDRALRLDQEVGEGRPGVAPCRVEMSAPLQKNFGLAL